MQWIRQWARASVPRERRLGLGWVGLTLLASACAGAPQPEVRAGSSPAALLGQNRGYLVVFRPAARWAPGQPLPEEPRQQHSQYLLSLYRAGALKFAGRFGDGSGGAMFFAAPNDAAALALVQADPAVVNDVFDFELRPWMLADWEERAATWPK
jgi:uncharacterized protein YciI